ncbi:MAG: hypothetical protein A3F17_09320 [Gammaproteobacteria bacterium RIFCSPHIGHO2_12_FULL_41_15]|nr:MAG: hypothetical protein A3F17_09320 [Gammaproteobacteria bacterium RIFCSPHIGHO2_12_FULL_41_15]
MTSVNKALLRPLLIAGVEKRLLVLNSIICFPLVAATHLHFPSALLGFFLFSIIHALLIQVSKKDPHLGKLMRRSSRYIFRPYFYAKSHPLQCAIWPIKTVSVC